MQIRNTLKILTCGAGEGWSRSTGLKMWEMRHYKESQRKGISYIKYKGGNLT
jgi:hypothetical protein